VESLLLVLLVGETHESVSARHSADRIRHDLGRLARSVLALEERHEDVLVDLWTEITDEDGEFRTTVVTTAIGEAATGSPVELELAVGVWNDLSIELEGASSLVGVFKINEAVSSVASVKVNTGLGSEGYMSRDLPREFVANHLDVDLVSHAEPHAAHEVLIDPWLKLTHPKNHSLSILVHRHDL
jgi:hypothetical protein